MSSRSSSRQATAIRAPAAVTIKSTPDSAADTVSMVTRANRTAGHRAAVAEGARAAVSPQVVVRWVSGLRASSTNARRSRIRPRGAVVVAVMVVAVIVVAVVAVAVVVVMVAAAVAAAVVAAAAVRLTEVFSRSSPRNPQPL